MHGTKDGKAPFVGIETNIEITSNYMSAEELEKYKLDLANELEAAAGCAIPEDWPDGDPSDGYAVIMGLVYHLRGED